MLHSKLLNNQMARWYQRLDMAWDSETPRKTGIQDGTQKMGICSKKTWTMHDCIHCIQQTIEGMNRKKIGPSNLDGCQYWTNKWGDLPTRFRLSYPKWHWHDSKKNRSDAPSGARRVRGDRLKWQSGKFCGKPWQVGNSHDIKPDGDLQC